MTSPYDPQPLYPDPHDFLTHKRATSPHTRFRPITSPATKPARTKGTRARKPKATKQPHQHATRPARPLTAPAHQQAHRASRTGSPKHANADDIIKKDPIGFALLQQQNELMLETLIPKALGAGYGYANGHISKPGHHPQASGHPNQSVTSQHHALARRAIIVSYSSTTGLAVVRDADSPDAPGYSVKVSPALSPAVMSAASEAGLALWDTGDPADILVSTVV